MPRTSTDPVLGEDDVGGGGSLDGRDVAVGILSGAAGMVAMAAVLAVAWLLDALDPAGFAGLATPLGVGPNLAVGLLVFAGLGVVTFPLFFVAVAPFFPERSPAARGAALALAAWAWFAVAFFTGQTGASLAAYVLLGLVAHLAYGAVLGGVYGRYGTFPQYGD